MFGQKFLLVIGIFFLVFAFTKADEECIPRSVNNVRLLSNVTLVWDPNPQETCEIIHFRVNIYRGTFAYELTVQEPWADVSFLPVCDLWLFQVRSISPDMVGGAHSLYTRIPMPINADLTLKRLGIAKAGTGYQLEWELSDEFRYCADSYRIAVADEEIDEITDYYISDTKLNLNFTAPCVVYEFGVRAIYKGYPTYEGPLRSVLFEIPPARQTSPQVRTVEASPTSLDITWNLESTRRNRCPIRRFFVDGGNYFNFSLDIVDQFDRKPITVHLSSLRANSMYLIRAAIENSAGLSYPSVLGAQTLDIDPSL